MTLSGERMSIKETLPLCEPIATLFSFVLSQANDVKPFPSFLCKHDEGLGCLKSQRIASQSSEVDPHIQSFFGITSTQVIVLS
ncbi:GSCOCG00002197001-RA-CDS [Cotesia congregata]|nr:GSCOCG00002197001-RA-CDS [Cotesia congregata]